MNSLTRLGIGIALVGGAANSMLYNGIHLNIKFKFDFLCVNFIFNE